MRRGPITFLVAATLLGAVVPRSLQAKDRPARTRGEASPTEPIKSEDRSAQVESDSEPPASTTPATPELPKNAAAALVRAAAAYEYGDLNQVVEAARPVAEGLLPATAQEQAQAFRLLGIGLFLTNRPLGAEIAFTELLRNDPKARLNPTTTRPELVAFFENLRRQQLARQRSAKKVYWDFLPPVGQFQNDDHVKGWLIVGMAALSLGTFATTDILLRVWERPHNLSTHPNAAPRVKAANWISAGAPGAIYLYGVIDGIVCHGRPAEDNQPSFSLFFFPSGGGLRFTF